MLSHTITDVRQFMHHLLSAGTFDRFLFAGAQITMGIRWEIDGRIQPSFYDTDSLPSENYLPWEKVRPQVYTIVRGNRLPLSMKIILALPREMVNHLLARSGQQEEDSTCEMFLNILYHPDELILTTGISRSGFSLDKTPEQVFDDSIRSFLRKHKLA